MKKREINRVEIVKVVEITTTVTDEKTGQRICVQEYWTQHGKKIGEVGPKIETEKETTIVIK